MDNDLIGKITILKKRIEDEKARKNRLQGAHDAQKSQLNQLCGTSDPVKALKIAEEHDKKANEYVDKAEKILDDLEEKYGIVV